MLDRLNRLAEEATELHSRLVLVVGKPGSGKSNLLREFAVLRGSQVLNLGLKLAFRLVNLPKRQRALHAASALRDAVLAHAAGDLVVADNLEILFDRSLQMDPLDALRRLSHGRTLVVAWPGALISGRLSYAPPEHPEHQDYPAAGLVLLQLS
jgi:chloramphenicol 3-O-phosphotransferase